MAFIQNAFPTIQFREFNDVPRPNRLQSVARLGAVGTFRKGAPYVLRLHDSMDSFSYIHGKTLHQGSVGIQTAYDQGATDVGTIRVLGRAVKATVDITFNIANVGTMVGGTLTLTVNQLDPTDDEVVLDTQELEIAISSGSTPAQVAGAIIAAINADTEGVATLVTAVAGDPGVMTVQATDSGITGNRLRLDMAVADITGVTISYNLVSGETFPESDIPLAGGVAGPVRSSLAIRSNPMQDSCYATVVLGGSVNHAAVAATATVTLSGTVANTETFTAVVGGVSFVYTCDGDDALNDAATGLAALIHAHASYNAAAVGPVITITIAAAGDAGNATTLTVSDTAASGSIAASGSTFSGGLDIAAVTVSIDDEDYTVTDDGNDTVDDIGAKLVTAINASSVVEAAYTASTNTLTITTRALKATITEADVEISTSVEGSITATASGDILTTNTIITLYAASEGVWGNNLLPKISRGQNASTYNLVIEDTETGDREVYSNLTFAAANIQEEEDGTFTYRPFVNSELIRGVAEAASSSFVPEYISTVSLAGGDDGPTITTDDYLEALDVLSEQNVNIIFAPGQTNASIRAALIAQAENSTVTSGVRIAIVNADRNIAVESADAQTEDYNTTSGRVVFIAGWVTYAGQPKLPARSVSPDGFHAGKLAVTDVHVSPAARASSPYYQNVLDVDTKSTTTAMNAYTRARMEAIVRDPVTGGYHSLNGRTLASDSAWYWVSVRRTHDQVMTDINANVQWVRSQPNTPSLRSQLAQQLDTYMQQRMALGMFSAIKDSIVSSVNNSASSVAAGYLRAAVYFEPVYPADQVIFDIHRFLSAELTTPVGA